ncbi:MAG TPA: DUF92 domain-containing protein [Anaerolineae bacterium]|nr:DUF92 domain-containing protein [Anaerolineae bacterium]HOQ98097.1 DUF92 domain-containing protein [Anaerolineae bacterium]HPL26808.1 DUF92 domain-containing protein [Anaerolineae bacterium]HPL26819.1 DUF92 domain-containing protein [Anaerolineae bacterium]
MTGLLGLGLRTAAGLALSAAIAWAGYKRESLSRSGLWGAIVVGTLIFGLGGWVWGLLLIAFFVTSSALSHYGSRRKQSLAEHFAKTGRRDLGQTLANGSLGAALAVANALTGGTHPLLFFAFTGALAAVNADTWATELGILSGEQPRLITTGEPVEWGTSGGISSLGALASVAGAWTIGFLALAFGIVQGRLSGMPAGPRLGWLPLVAAFAGLAGSLLDSLLGATVQATYYCLHCGKETEQPLHRCGRQPIFLRGWHWLDNDWVNFVTSLAGALVATAFGALVLYL